MNKHTATHKHTFKNEHYICWHGKIVKFCDDPLCLWYKEKGDDRYIYNAKLNEDRQEVRI